MKEYIDREALLIELGKNSIIDKITYSDGKTIREKIAEFPAANITVRMELEPLEPIETEVYIKSGITKRF